MTITRVAQRYAAAIYDAAAKVNLLAEFTGDFGMLERALAASRELQLFFQSPILSMDLKLKTATELLEANLHPFSLGTVLFLIRQHRENSIRDIIREFFALEKKRRNIQLASVTSARDIPDEQKERVEKALRALTRKNVEVSYTLDPEIRGGLVLRIGDTVYDGSVTRQLERIRRRFIEGAAA